jgi:hypothetical protein
MRTHSLVGRTKTKKRSCVTFNLKKVCTTMVYTCTLMCTAVVNEDLKTIAEYPKTNCSNLHNHVTAECSSISLGYHLNIYDIVFAVENDSVNLDRKNVT